MGLVKFNKTKTLEQAKTLTATNPDTIYFPTDSTSIVMGGVEYGGGGSSVTVVDNLASTSTTSALSANQGKVLKDTIDNMNSYVSIVSDGLGFNFNDDDGLTRFIASGPLNIKLETGDGSETTGEYYYLTAQDFIQYGTESSDGYRYAFGMSADGFIAKKIQNSAGSTILDITDIDISSGSSEKLILDSSQTLDYWDGTTDFVSGGDISNEEMEQAWEILNSNHPENFIWNESMDFGYFTFDCYYDGANGREFVYKYRGSNKMSFISFTIGNSTDKTVFLHDRSNWS